ncbi:MAG TPA: hypothetical protein VEA38_09390 [Terriglobales bacterium]|nr:hypothetical protein [Terriglobales bacterium]
MDVRHLQETLYRAIDRLPTEQRHAAAEVATAAMLHVQFTGKRAAKALREVATFAGPDAPALLELAELLDPLRTRAS